MKSSAGAVVVGSGALGLSAALHLAQLGLRNVVVAEQYEPGSQTSPRAAGLFKLIQPDQTRTALARLSVHKVLHFEQETGVSLPVVQSGSIMMARTPEHAAMIEAEVAQSRRWGIEIETVDASEARRLMPFLGGTGVQAACYVPGDVYIEEPASLLQAYLAAATQRGVHVYAQTRVTAIRLQGDAVAAVVTEAGEIETPIVVDAAGAWARGVGALARAEIPVAPVRHQLYITAPITGIAAEQPILRVVDAAVYVRPARGGLMLGGFEADPLPLDPRAAGPDFTAGDVPLDLAVLQSLTASVLDQVPALHDAPIQEHRGGLFTMTPDGRFLVGPVRGVRGLWCATGCNGSGFSSSPALGQVLAEWIVEGAPSIDLSILQPGRFAPGAFDDDRLRQAGTWQYAHYYDPAASQPA